MYNDQFIQDLDASRNNDQPAAVATVVRREAPTSGKPGDKAIITEKGEVKGWIGGGCTKGIVIKEAMEAIKQQAPRLVRIQTDIDAPDQEGVKNYKMTCHSGGSVEVYIEPIMQVSQIYIFGRSHIGRALAQVGAAAGFRIHVVSDLSDDEMFPSASSISTLKDFNKEQKLSNDYVVVCTQGENDAQNMLAAVNTQPKYLAFVSSRKKANSIFMGLKKEGVSFDELGKIKTPAGIDINAKTPEEVAISILAQIIQVKREATDTEQQNESSVESDLAAFDQSDLYINPVCKIPVQKSTAKYVLDYEDEKVYFCCDGCKEKFEQDPDAYMKV